MRRFPRRTLRADAELHRIHRARRTPWRFSADGSGRFDPIDREQGACYLAEEPLGAWIEVFRLAIVLDEQELLERSLTRVRTGRDLRLADLTSRRALQFGITTPTSGDDYTASQQFAIQALDAGFDGIRYLARHDPAQRLYGIALFGPAATSTPPDSATTDTAPIPDQLIQQATHRFGYRIVTRP